MITVECPLCHKRITHLDVTRDDGKLGSFCPHCRGELTSRQTEELNKEYFTKRMTGCEE